MDIRCEVNMLVDLVCPFLHLKVTSILYVAHQKRSYLLTGLKTSLGQVKSKLYTNFNIIRLKKINLKHHKEIVNIVKQVFLYIRQYKTYLTITNL